MFFDDSEFCNLGEIIHHHDDPSFAGTSRDVISCDRARPQLLIDASWRRCEAGRYQLWKGKRACRIHQDMLERPEQVERRWVARWGGQLTVTLTVVAGLAEVVGIFMQARPNKDSRQVLGCSSGAGVAGSIVCSPDEVKAVLQRWDGDPVSCLGLESLQERRSGGMQTVPLGAIAQVARSD